MIPDDDMTDYNNLMSRVELALKGCEYDSIDDLFDFMRFYVDDPRTVLEFIAIFISVAGRLEDELLPDEVVWVRRRVMELRYK